MIKNQNGPVLQLKRKAHLLQANIGYTEVRINPGKCSTDLDHLFVYANVSIRVKVGHVEIGAGRRFLFTLQLRIP